MDAAAFLHECWCTSHRLQVAAPFHGNNDLGLQLKARLYTDPITFNKQNLPPRAYLWACAPRTHVEREPVRSS